MPGYTNVLKPTGATYTKVKNGFPLYDDSTITYDDSMNYFDGFSPDVYTNIPKPIEAGTIWEQMTIAWSAATFPWGSYTNISKPT